MADNLMEHALQMERHAEQLATGLAKAGAPDEIVALVTKCASVGRALAKALGNQNQNPEAANRSPEDSGAGAPEDRMAEGEGQQDGAPPARNEPPFAQESRDLQSEVRRRRGR